MKNENNDLKIKESNREKSKVGIIARLGIKLKSVSMITILLLFVAFIRR